MAVDYSAKLRCAEEVVVGVIDDLLTEGGHMLWQKYLQRKAFPFAAENATDVLVSQLRLCYVAHDRGEPYDISDSEDWCLEPEPAPAEVDNWARMQLSIMQKKRKKIDNDLSPVVRDTRRMQTLRGRVSEARDKAKGSTGREKQSDSKSFDLKEGTNADEEEEKLRDMRQQEESRRRDRESKVRQNERAKEEEQRRVQALHEEMSKRMHTFDSEGGLIWVEELKLDRLPKVQEVVPYFVKRDPRKQGPADGDASPGKGKDSPVGKKMVQRGKRRDGMRRTGKIDEDDFPDGFSKLQHGQPPILETMQVKPGVVLDVYGKSKAGPAPSTAGGGMSRKEYVALTEKEVAQEGIFNSMSDPSGEHAGEHSSLAGPPGTAGSRSQAGDAGLVGDAGDTTLPPIGGGGLASTGTSRGGTASGVRGGGRGGGKAGEDAGGAGTGKKKSEVQTAPPAPHPSVRGGLKKMQAIGHLGQPPRLHVAPLGGPYGFGVAQPPLGATMGHGLIRHGSAKESYFFPHPVPKMPDLLRATSETSIGPQGRGGLGSGRRLNSPGSGRGASRGGSLEDLRSQTAPSKSLGDLDDAEYPVHGIIRAEKKSGAYRDVRQRLFPKTLSSGYVSGML